VKKNISQNIRFAIADELLVKLTIIINCHFISASGSLSNVFVRLADLPL